MDMKWYSLSATHNILKVLSLLLIKTACLQFDTCMYTPVHKASLIFFNVTNITLCLSHLREATEIPITLITKKSPSTARSLKREGNEKEPFQNKVFYNFN